jgi:RND family efflux transporter MFP subunit
MPEEKNPERLLPDHGEGARHGHDADFPVPALEQVVRKQQEEGRAKEEKPAKRKNPKRTLRAFGFVLLGMVVLALLGTGLVFFRRHRAVSNEKHKLADQHGQGPQVLVAKVSLQKPERAVTLPGDVRAFVDVGVFPKVNGYLRKVAADKGDRVREGDVLATIESPETDQQVAAARSNLRLKAVLAARARRLAPSGVISKSDLDNAVEGQRSAEADYKRTLALQSYETVRAPYAGTITARNVDPGALVSATTPLFELADPSRLRIWIYVAQDIAPFVRAGDAVEITQDERPGQVVHAQVSRAADALDPRSRTMLAEIWLDNKEGAVSPGVFVHVTLHVKVPPLPVVPSNAVLSRADKTLVAIVTAGNKLHLQQVQTGLDDGKVVQVREGVQPGQTVALDVPSELGDGAPIQPITPQQEKQAGAGPNPARSGGQQAQARAGPNPPRGGGQQQGGDQEKEKKEKKKEQKKDSSSKQPGE